MKRILILTVTAAAAAALATPSAAAAADGRRYGQHVVHCAQDVGFDDAHNPGMHQGFHSFTDHECVMA
jgi:hypothetical protein